MPLRLAFDLDGVFADMEGALARQAQALFGEATIVETAEASDALETNPKPVAAGDEPPLVRLHLSPRQQRLLWNHVEAIDNFWETLDEIEPGSLARLAALSESNRWEIIFLTRRPGSAGLTAQVQSQRWLRLHGFEWPSVFVVQGSRGRIAASLALDLVIDDTPENCIDVVADSKARAVLVWRDDRKALPPAVKRLGIGMVKSVEECLNVLSQVDPSREGVMDRVKRILGARGRRRAARPQA